MKNEFSFGDRSAKKLLTCTKDMQRVAHRALSFGVMDFSVYEGLRTDEKQAKYFAAGKSQIDGVHKRGKHQANEDGESEAFDVIPYPSEVNGVNVWNDKHRWYVLNGLMLAAAALEDVDIRSGCDWDGDGNNADSNFNDLPHYEAL